MPCSGLSLALFVLVLPSHSPGGRVGREIVDFFLKADSSLHLTSHK